MTGARLNLAAALADALRRLPDMARGAGGSWIAATALVLICALDLFEGWANVALGAATALAALAAFGAMTRIAVTPDLVAARRLGLGPLGFQLTRTEARLAGAVLLCGLFMTIMLSLLALVALALFGAAGLDAEAVRERDWGAVGPVWKLALLTLVGLVVLGTPVLLLVRLSLFAAATVGRGRMTSLGATALTNGAIAPLLAGLAACAIPTLVWLALAGSGVLTGAAAIIVGSLAVAGLQAPLTTGFLGAAYRQGEGRELLGDMG